MAKVLLPYKVNNKLDDLIKQKAKQEKKTKGEVEVELVKHCGLTVQIIDGREVAGAIKKYKNNITYPSLPVVLKIAEFFGENVESIFKLKEE